MEEIYICFSFITGRDSYDSFYRAYAPNTKIGIIQAEANELAYELYGGSPVDISITVVDEDEYWQHCHSYEPMEEF